MQVTGIILAGGKGSRFKSDGVNKTAAKLQGKPLVVYGVELLEQVTEKTVVVVGAFADSVREAVGQRPGILYAVQEEPLGTGHALNTAVDELLKRKMVPDLVVVGYADHMMFYKPETVKSMIRLAETEKAAVVLLTTKSADPNKLRWGRIIRNDQNEIVRIVEQKDATEEEKKVEEINPGFYCFDFKFLTENKQWLEKSRVTGEYYITDYVQMATDRNLKVLPLLKPFTEVGLGVNTRAELAEDENFKKETAE